MDDVLMVTRAVSFVLYGERFAGREPDPVLWKALKMVRSPEAYFKDLQDVGVAVHKVAVSQLGNPPAFQAALCVFYLTLSTIFEPRDQYLSKALHIAVYYEAAKVADAVERSGGDWQPAFDEAFAVVMSVYTEEEVE